MNKRAQVWIETVIYTMIAFILIAAVLAFVKPKIEELQDKAIIDQSIVLLKDLDKIILEIVQGGPGNKRERDISIRKGEMTIDAVNDKIIFELESDYIYSEPGKEIQDGNLKITTIKSGSLNLVKLVRDYDDYNITFNGQDENKIITKAATAYSFSLLNKGKEDAESKWQIDLEVN